MKSRRARASGQNTREVLRGGFGVLRLGALGTICRLANRPIRPAMRQAARLSSADEWGAMSRTPRRGIPIRAAHRCASTEVPIPLVVLFRKKDSLVLLAQVVPPSKLQEQSTAPRNA